tara:strand:+ start:116 stop:1081 length:966 start_codon:yes stop_codon:yes gene_type:complete
MIIDIIIIVIATFSTWYASEILSRGTEGLGNKFNLSSSVKGATLDAVGSSFPEFCTVVFCLIAGSFEAGIGAITGSAMFNILIIPSLCVILTKNMTINKDVVYRDGLLYIITVILLILSIMNGSPNPINDQEFFINGSIGMLAIIIYIIYTIILIIKSKEVNNNTINRQPTLSKIILFLILGMGGIAISIHYLVNSSLSLCNNLNLSEGIAGITILAAATSLPDTFLSIISAKKGESDAALSNTLGSNTFNILICLGVPIFYLGGIYFNWIENSGILFYLLFSSILSMLIIRYKWELTKTGSTIMLITYFIFIILVVLQIL